MKDKDKKISEKNSVLVGMSGGVDSAAAALVLKEKGFDVSGVHFTLLEDVDSSSKVKRLAKEIGIPLIVRDLSEVFKREVVDDFNSEYAKGKTPNPCVVCNPLVKFSNLLDVAKQECFSRIATGHYACVEKNSEGVFLKKATDETKDQSYFLYRLSQEELGKIEFPLCGMRKSQVKEYVENKGVEIEGGESQDVCFFHAKESLRDFLEKSIPRKEGEIVDEGGAVLGPHQGGEFFTIGQRHGLDVNGGPFYVINKIAEENKVIVSKNRNHPNLFARKIIIGGVSWVLNEPIKDKRYGIKTRYLCKEVQGTIEKVKKRWVVTMKEPQWAASPGQSLVLYDGDSVVGGGFIESTISV